MYGAGMLAKDVFSGTSDDFVKVLVMAAPAMTMMAVPFIFIGAMKGAAALVGAGGAFGAISKRFGSARKSASSAAQRHLGNTSGGQAMKNFRENMKNRESARAIKNGSKGVFAKSNQKQLLKKDMLAGGTKEDLEKQAYTRAQAISQNPNATEAQRASAFATMSAYDDKQDKIANTMVANDPDSINFAKSMEKLKNPNLTSSQRKAWVSAASNTASNHKDLAELNTTAFAAAGGDAKLQNAFAQTIGKSSIAQKHGLGVGDEIKMMGSQKVSNGSTYSAITDAMASKSAREISDSGFEKGVDAVNQIHQNGDQYSQMMDARRQSISGDAIQQKVQNYANAPTIKNVDGTTKQTITNSEAMEMIAQENNDESIRRLREKTEQVNNNQDLTNRLTDKSAQHLLRERNGAGSESIYFSHTPASPSQPENSRPPINQ
jgi:hypothetical protein